MTSVVERKNIEADEGDQIGQIPKYKYIGYKIQNLNLQAARQVKSLDA